MKVVDCMIVNSAKFEADLLLLKLQIESPGVDEFTGRAKAWVLNRISARLRTCTRPGIVFAKFRVKQVTRDPKCPELLLTLVSGRYQNVS